MPKEVLAKLQAVKGTTLYLTESPEGFLLTRYDQEFAEQMKLAEEVMDEYKDALHVRGRSFPTNLRQDWRGFRRLTYAA